MFERYRKIQERRARGENGFTLIELLIVIVVLAILAAIVIFGLSGITGQSTQSACRADVKSVETAQETYKSTPGNANYAAGYAQLTAAGPNGPYLRQVPSTDHYTISTDGSGQVWVNPAKTAAPLQDAAHNYDTQKNATPTSVDLCTTMVS